MIDTLTNYIIISSYWLACQVSDDSLIDSVLHPLIWWLSEHYLLISILTALIQINNKQSQSIIMCDWSVMMYWQTKGSIDDISYPDTQTDRLINKGYWDFIQGKLNYLLIRLINRSSNRQIKRSFSLNVIQIFPAK